MPGGETREEAEADGADELRVRQRWRCRPEARLCEAEYELLLDGRRVATSTFRGRYWTPEEIDRSFRRAGLAVEELWGDYRRSAWTPSSDRLVVAASPA